MDLSELKNVDVTAVSRGLSNLRRHISNIKKFGVPVIVAINRFSADSDSEIMEIKNNISSLNVDVVECNHWKNGSEGIIDLATKVSELVDEGVSQFQPLYEENQSLFEKINIICREIYGAKEAIANKSIREKLREWESQGFGKFPICIAKTQYSFSTDPNLLGAPKDHVVPIREVRLSAGAEFVVAICGQIMTLPGLPSEPAANNIRLDDNDLITGLF